MPIDQGKLKSEFRSLLGPVKFRLFSLVSMPTARFAGLRVDHLDDSSCVTSIPGGWRSQNPFKTMYWAVQGMGAELATGAAPFAMARSMPEKLRMFVVGTDASFTKRARGRISFSCEDVSAARKAIEYRLLGGVLAYVSIQSSIDYPAEKSAMQLIFHLR